MSSGNVELDIPPPLTIRQARPLRQLILDALQDGSSLTLRLPEPSAADLSFVQLVESARIYAARTGLSLTLAAPADAGLLKLVEDAGLPAASLSFWQGQGGKA
jgi:hypothetical protein